MSLAELVVDDLRCIERAELRLAPGQNLICGGNGSGKTSLLEAIFLLGRGRSFRTRSSERLIRHGRERLVVFGRTYGPGAAGATLEIGRGSTAALAAVRAVLEVGDDSDAPAGADSRLFVPAAYGATLGRGSGGATANDTVSGVGDGPGSRLSSGPPTGIDGGWTTLPGVPLGVSTGALVGGQALGIQVSRADGTLARISGATATSLTELTQVFPVQVIDPGIHKLVEEGGHRRRRWMDWAVFHVEHAFGDWWVRYTRALKQRNAALKTQPAQATAWDGELVRLGELIADARRRFVEGLLPYWKASVVALSGLEPELHYFKGWAQDMSLADAFTASRARDEAKRLTHSGPHRADVLIRMSGRPAREVLSRGQQKLVAVAMTLAQLNLLQEATQTTPTLLLDDPAAELDGEHLRRFIEQVKRLRSQLVLTSLHPESHLFGTPDQVFHVEQGRVRPGYAV